MVHMQFLRSSSKTIAFEAFHVFKIFAANPQKKPKVVRILYQNREKLAAFLDKFLDERSCDQQFLQDKATVIQKLKTLELPPSEGEGGGRGSEKSAGSDKTGKEGQWGGQRLEAKEEAKEGGRQWRLVLSTTNMVNGAVIIFIMIFSLLYCDQGRWLSKWFSKRDILFSLFCAFERHRSCETFFTLRLNGVVLVIGFGVWLFDVEGEILNLEYIERKTKKDELLITKGRVKIISSLISVHCLKCIFFF